MSFFVQVLRILFFSRNYLYSTLILALWVIFMSSRPLSVDYLNYEYMFSVGIPYKLVDIPLLWSYNLFNFSDIYYFRFFVYLFFGISIFLFCLSNRLSLFPFLFNPFLISMGAFFGKSLICYAFLFISLVTPFIGLRLFLYLLAFLFHPVSALSFFVLFTRIPYIFYYELRKLLLRFSLSKQIFRFSILKFIFSLSVPIAAFLAFRYYSIAFIYSPYLSTVLLYLAYAFALIVLFLCCKSTTLELCVTPPRVTNFSNITLLISRSAIIIVFSYLLLFPMSFLLLDYFSRLYMPALILFSGFLGSFYYELHSRLFFILTFTVFTLSSIFYFLFFASSAPFFRF